MPNPEEISEVLAFVLLSGPKRSIFPQEQSGALLHLGVDYRIVGYVDTGGGMGAARDGEMREGIQVQVSAEMEHTAWGPELILCGELD